MKPNTHGGGATTNLNGLHFEQTTSLNEAIVAIPNYSIDGRHIKYNGQIVGETLAKNALYKYFFDPRGIHYKDVISKKLLPDDAIFINQTQTLHIIEKKFQKVDLVIFWSE